MEEGETITWVSKPQRVCRSMKWNHHVNALSARPFSLRSKLKHREAQNDFKSKSVPEIKVKLPGADV